MNWRSRLIEVNEIVEEGRGRKKKAGRRMKNFCIP
jgi:hypothetical protein